MKKAISLLAICALLVTVMASCTTFQMSGVQVSTAKSTATVLGTFDINVKVTEFLGSSGGANLGNITATASDAAITAAIQAEIAKLGGTAAIDVKIEYKATFIDLLLNGVTGSIYAPATAHITGSIVK